MRGLFGREADHPDASGTSGSGGVGQAAQAHGVGSPPHTPSEPGGDHATLDALETKLGDGAPLGAREAGLARSVGADPDALRLHTGPAAAEVAAEHDAVALAAGQHVVMGSAAPAPGTPDGDTLLLHEAAHVAQQQDAARDPRQREMPIGVQAAAAEDNADQAVMQAAFGGKASDATRTGVQVQRGDPAKAARGMDRARYHAIELRLKNLVAQKQGMVDGSAKGDMDAIGAEIDKLIGELRVDFGVQLDRGKILDDAMASKDMLVVDGRVVLSPSGTGHYMGERLGAKLEIDHLPPGETLQIGWRWRTPGSGRAYRFLVNSPAFSEKTTSQEMELDTPFWGLVPDAVEKEHGLEIVAEIYLGKADHPTKTLSTGFIAMPERPIGEVKIVGAPDRVVKDSSIDLGIGPWTPDFRRYSIDWFVDDAQVASDQLALRHQYKKLGKHVARADVYRVKRSFGIRDKQFIRNASVAFDVLTDEQYGNKFLNELETSPFRPKPVGVNDLLTSGDRSVDEIQHRIDQGGSQQAYWEDRRKAQKERLAKVREFAPDHVVAKPLPADPTKLDPGGSYSGPITAALVMSSGGGAQPLTLHLTIRDVGGVWQARLIDSTSKKVLKADGTGATPLSAYAAVFETWRTDNEYPTGGRIVHRFAPTGWAAGSSFSTTTSWKKAKEWVDGILQVGGFLVGMLLLADPDPTISKLLGGLLMATAIARSSVAIYERIRNGGDVLSTENILDGVSIVTSFVGLGGGALRSLGITARSPIMSHAGKWMIMSAVAGDAGTLIYASSEALASLRTIQSDPTMDESQKSGELLRIMGSLFLSGAMLIATNRELFRNGLKPHDLVKNDLPHGTKPDLDVGSRLDAEYELKKSGQWSKETPKLSDEAVLDKLFTQRTRQDLESSIAKKAGTKPAAALADALGNDAFVELHHTLGEDTMVGLAKDLGPAKTGALHKELGTSDLATVVKELGIPHVRHLADGLGGKQLKVLVDGLGTPALKRTAGLVEVEELKHLSLAGGSALKKFAGLHGLDLKNLSHRTPAELAELAKLDDGRIAKVSTLSPSEAAKAAPFSETAVDAKLAELGVTEKHVGTELADPNTAHHIRETNFADRGAKQNPSGRVIKLNVPGRGAPVSVETPKYVRLEPIPAGAAGGAHPTTINRIEVEAPRSDSPSKPVVRGELIRGPTDWDVPIPGDPYPKVFVDVSPGGLVPYTTVEAPPPGTRIQVKPRDIANSGIAGGHTRQAWDAAEHAYGDMLSKKSESGIKFKVPGSATTIDAAAIHAQVKIGPNTKDLPDPKTIFERATDLNAFENHAKHYIAAKVDALKHAARRPIRGDVVTIDVPVSLTSGTDAIIKVEMPWNAGPDGQVDIKTWWLAQSNFAKGSAFNP